MDLDPLQPEEPAGGPPAVVPPSSWAWNDPTAGAGGEQWAPGPESEGAVAGPGPWHTDAPGGGPGGPRPPRFSRRTKILAGATALLTVVAAAWAAGSAGGSHTPTVRIEPAVAAANGSTGSSGSSSSAGSTGSGPSKGGNGFHRGGRFGGMFAWRGAAGTVASLDAPSFTLTRPARPAPPTSSTSTSTTAEPATTSVTVTTSTTTTYQEYESAAFTSSDAPVGARIAAVGTRNADGSLTATTITVIPAGMGAGAHTRTPSASGTSGPSTTLGPRTLPPNAAARLSKAPFALGQVSATTGSPAVLTITTPWGTETVTTTSATTFTSLVSTDISFDTLAVGQRVIIRGQRQSNGDVAASAVTIIPAGVTPSPLGFGLPGFGGPGFAGGGPVGGPAAAGGPGGPWAGYGRFGRGRPAPATAAPAPVA